MFSLIFLLWMFFGWKHHSKVVFHHPTYTNFCKVSSVRDISVQGFGTSSATSTICIKCMSFKAKLCNFLFVGEMCVILDSLVSIVSCGSQNLICIYFVVIVLCLGPISAVRWPSWTQRRLTQVSACFLVNLFCWFFCIIVCRLQSGTKCGLGSQRTFSHFFGS